MKRRRLGPAVLLAAACLVGPSHAADPPWSPRDLTMLRSLWIGSLPPAPDDPSNAFDADPRAARLGRRLFFDPRISANGRLSCATCHPADLGFVDRRPVAEGLAPLTRRSMPLAGVAWNTWFFWDGRKDSLWSQALAPIEDARELGATRRSVAALVAREYRDEYAAVFGPLPDLVGKDDRDPDVTRVFVNAGKAIAAWERTIRPLPSRFDRYVEAVLDGREDEAARSMSPAERRGLALFIGRARCTNCHAGPLLTNGEFEFTRVPLPNSDPGRAGGLEKIAKDEFSCLGRFSDAKPEQCTALRFRNTDTRDARYAFKTPSLRNVASRAPYMHAGQIATLQEVLRFYRDGTAGVPELGHQGLSDADLADLEAFLGTLTGPIDALGDGG